LINLVQDARRFIQYYKWAIENTPLQVYASALIFSPAHSLTRKLFKQEKPEWILTKPAMQDDWSSCLQTLQGHAGSVTSLAFSHDDKRVTSASSDQRVKIWDAASGKCLQTLQGHAGSVTSVAFSHDDKRVTSASDD
jgi:WD40 repeat protein